MADVNRRLETFLNQHLPQCVEKVEQISGGLTNYTFRLHLKNELPSLTTNELNDNNLLTIIYRVRPRSMIVKIAYPYMAAFDGPYKIPLERQATETRVLQMFHNTSAPTNDTKLESIDLSAVLYRNKTIRVGRVWFFSAVDHILVMEDLGPLPHMTQWMTYDNQVTLATSTPILARTYGEQLGNFILDIQVFSSYHTNQIDLSLYDPEVKSLHWKYIPSVLKNVCDIHGLPDADELVSILNRYCEHDLLRPAMNCQVLSHSDLWVGNILVDEDNQKLVIIDWEYAALRSPAFDLTLFLARSLVHEETDPLYEPMINFTAGFIKAYRNGARKREVSWYKNECERYLFAWALGISYAAQLIDWLPFQKCCPFDDEKCCHRRVVVEKAANYLRRCHLGPVKDTYEFIFHDQVLGKLFQVEDNEI